MKDDSILIISCPLYHIHFSMIYTYSYHKSLATHFTKVWAHNSNMIKQACLCHLKNNDLHMTWQLSCLDMCKFGTCLVNWIKITAKTFFNRIVSSKTLCVMGQWTHWVKCTMYIICVWLSEYFLCVYTKTPFSWVWWPYWFMAVPSTPMSSLWSFWLVAGCIVDRTMKMSVITVY